MTVAVISRLAGREPERGSLRPAEDNRSAIQSTHILARLAPPHMTDSFVASGSDPLRHARLRPPGISFLRIHPR